jgi:NhaP-type Na+/H+ or K+/H+ antiporter
VVPLAAALSIPLTTASGAALPQRDLVLVLAATAIVISLIVQGFTLEPLARFAGFGKATTADPAASRPSPGCAWPKLGLPAWTSWPKSALPPMR